MRSTTEVAALAMALAALSAPGPLPAQPEDPAVPVVRFHFGDAGELLQTAYPDRYGVDGGRLAEDVEWARDHSEEVTGWWESQGMLFLQRLEDLTGLPWRYRQIDVYLVRYWPVISIEHPLVLALDAIRLPGGEETPVPEEEDVRALLLAHQVAHHLLDDPEFVPDEALPAAFDHPLMAPGNYAVEALVNWVVYRALGELWGESRLRAAVTNELWRAYNPNHGFVVDELEPRHRLSRLATLADWLEANPEESEIFRVREAYLEQSTTPVAAIPERERATGNDYGLDLAATYEGRIFVAYVDEGSPAARSGLVEGDVLLTIEGRLAGEDVTAAQVALDASWETNREINVSVERGGEELFFTLEEP
ncbi:MAG: PDZ domain-containing protein [Gemmatimonadota bacterium]